MNQPIETIHQVEPTMNRQCQSPVPSHFDDDDDDDDIVDKTYAYTQLYVIMQVPKK